MPMRNQAVPEELIPKWIREEEKQRNKLVKEFKQNMHNLYDKRKDHQKVDLTIEIKITFK
jgi:hypothetical protein